VRACSICCHATQCVCADSPFKHRWQIAPVEYFLISFHGFLFMKLSLSSVVWEISLTAKKFLDQSPSKCSDGLVECEHAINFWDPLYQPVCRDQHSDHDVRIYRSGAAFQKILGSGLANRINPLLVLSFVAGSSAPPPYCQSVMVLTSFEFLHPN